MNENYQMNVSDEKFSFVSVLDECMLMTIYTYRVDTLTFEEEKEEEEEGFGQTNTYTRSLLEPKPLPPRNEFRCWSAPTRRRRVELEVGERSPNK